MCALIACCFRLHLHLIRFETLISSSFSFFFFFQVLIRVGRENEMDWGEEEGRWKRVRRRRKQKCKKIVVRWIHNNKMEYYSRNYLWLLLLTIESTSWDACAKEIWRSIKSDSYNTLDVFQYPIGEWMNAQNISLKYEMACPRVYTNHSWATQYLWMKWILSSKSLSLCLLMFSTTLATSIYYPNFISRVEWQNEYGRLYNTTHTHYAHVQNKKKRNHLSLSDCRRRLFYYLLFFRAQNIK